MSGRKSMSDRDYGILEALLIVIVPVAILLAVVGIGSWELVKRVVGRIKRVQTAKHNK